jgi:hypothetical protein
MNRCIINRLAEEVSLPTVEILTSPKSRKSEFGQLPTITVPKT